MGRRERAMYVDESHWLVESLTRNRALNSIFFSPFSHGNRRFVSSQAEGKKLNPRKLIFLDRGNVREKWGGKCMIIDNFSNFYGILCASGFLGDLHLCSGRSERGRKFWGEMSGVLWKILRQRALGLNNLNYSENVCVRAEEAWVNPKTLNSKKGGEGSHAR